MEIGSDIVLTHLRLERHGETDLELEAGQIEAGKPVPGEGHPGGGADPLFDHLSAVLEAINQEFGADLDERDRLEAEKLKITLLADEDLKSFARANSAEHYALEFGPKFKGAILDQEERNRRLYDLLLSKPELAAMLEKELARETYLELRDDETKD